MSNSRLPRLSFVYAGRNDGYMGNFNWRLCTTLNYLAHNLQALGRLPDVEAVIADWGSQEPLHTALSLSPAAKRIARFVLVPPDLARAAQKDSDFAIVIAQNAAIRRSRGEYIGQADSDMLFTAKLLKTLLDVLDNKAGIGAAPEQAMLFTKRRHVPWRYVASSPSIEELDWLIQHWGHWLPVETFMGFEFAGPGFMIMHRKLWDECTGYDERLIYRGWLEIDLGLRIRRKYPLVNLQKIGVTAFHLEHFPSRGVDHLRRKSNPTEWNNAFRPNGNTWGMGDLELEVFAPVLQANETPGETLDRRPVRLNSTLLANIAMIILNRLWYPVQYAVGRVALLARRSLFHLGVIRRLVAGHALKEWPAIVGAWWAARQQRH